ncbi:flagellar biosynthesis protein FlhB [Xanthobacteraceae bacterium Astr-EGSB]|uniref:flagellar biosynthesis protein FlhB n=1 Tax=Astrobacterium formosum TaxID=3069710 RepID=UPI0027AFE8CB|nr:flagellar biosynthesis protein FlhB [Xanthobacteraceae bacterium Astr-EGSB]
MADEDDSEKTEDPTQKRLDDAIKRGDVVKSQEVSTWFVIAASALVLLGFSGSMSNQLQTMFRGLLGNAHRVPADGGGLTRLFERIGIETLAAVAVPFLILALAAIAGNMIQHRLVWSTESLTPKFSKISPMGGAKRMFSKQALANFLKGLLKLVVVGSVLTALVWPERDRLEELVSVDPIALLPFTKHMSLQLIGAVVAILAIIAGADYLFQYQQWFKRQKMSMREIKDEFRDSEGDPKIKAKIRQLRQNRVRKRMMAEVPNATVVVTNPTHFAVALKYERGMNAPLCVAKGADLIALKIREVAKEHGVPVVENPPLARALHATVEIDQEVPAEHYKAVAEVIGYVMRLNRRAAN